MTLQVTIYPSENQTQILATYDGHDCLKGSLIPRPLQRRALPTLLEGLALWYATPVHAAVVVDETLDPGRVEDLWGGGFWPQELSNVHFEIVEPAKRFRLRGPGDFSHLYLLHGGTR
jgi:hypothetical protein